MMSQQGFLNDDAYGGGNVGRGRCMDGSRLREIVDDHIDFSVLLRGLKFCLTALQFIVRSFRYKSSRSISFAISCSAYCMTFTWTLQCCYAHSPLTDSQKFVHDNPEPNKLCGWIHDAPVILIDAHSSGSLGLISIAPGRPSPRMTSGWSVPWRRHSTRWVLESSNASRH